MTSPNFPIARLSCIFPLPEDPPSDVTSVAPWSASGRTSPFRCSNASGSPKKLLRPSFSRRSTSSWLPSLMPAHEPGLSSVLFSFPSLAASAVFGFRFVWSGSLFWRHRLFSARPDSRLFSAPVLVRFWGGVRLPSGCGAVLDLAFDGSLWLLVSPWRLGSYSVLP